MLKPPQLPRRYREPDTDRSAAANGDREDKTVAVMVRLPQSARRDLKIIAARKMTSVQALITEQLNDILVKHGMERIDLLKDRSDRVAL